MLAEFTSYSSEDHDTVVHLKVDRERETMHSRTAMEEQLSDDNSELVGQYFVDDIIPGFVDDATYYDVARPGHDQLGQLNATTNAHLDSSRTAVAMPDVDGAVISVFAVAVILLVVGQAVVVCRQRHRRSCRRRCRKWNVPVFGQFQGMALAGHGRGPPIRSPPPSEVWTALPSSPLSDLFHSDNYRTAAFAYINRRSTDSLPSNAAIASPTGSSASSTAAIFVPTASSVTWSDVGERTSSSPEKRRPTTSLSLSSSSGADATTTDRMDDRPATADHPPVTDDSHPGSPADDDVIVTSSASINCSPTHSLRSVSADEVDDDDSTSRQSFSLIDATRPPDDRGQVACSIVINVDHSLPASSQTTPSSSSTDANYIQLTTDCSSTAHPDTDNSVC